MSRSVDNIHPITSKSNPKFKAAKKLRERRARREQDRFAVEGLREFKLALQGGFEVLEIFLCSELTAGTEAESCVAQIDARVYDLPLELFNDLAVRDDSGGLFSVFRYKSESKIDQSRPFWVILDGVEKPGNIGAILRTADAAGCTGVITTAEAGNGADFFNPNVIRNSLGAVFTVPVASMGYQETLDFCRAAGARVVVSYLGEKSVSLYKTDLSRPVAIVLGSEAGGVGQFWCENADAMVVIPMFGSADSLNAASAASVMIYEAVRQQTATKN